MSNGTREARAAQREAEYKEVFTKRDAEIAALTEELDRDWEWDKEEAFRAITSGLSTKKAAKDFARVLRARGWIVVFNRESGYGNISKGVLASYHSIKRTLNVNHAAQLLEAVDGGGLGNLTRLVKEF